MEVPGLGDKDRDGWLQANAAMPGSGVLDLCLCLFLLTKIQRRMQHRHFQDGTCDQTGPRGTTWGQRASFIEECASVSCPAHLC